MVAAATSKLEVQRLTSTMEREIVSSIVDRLDSMAFPNAVSAPRLLKLFLVNLYLERRPLWKINVLGPANSKLSGLKRMFGRFPMHDKGRALTQLRATTDVSELIPHHYLVAGDWAAFVSYSYRQQLVQTAAGLHQVSPSRYKCCCRRVSWIA